eukprot:scaffold27706_cov20-Tisochrysis_lutea.AAC.1
MGIHEQAGGGHKASGRPEELALQMHLVHHASWEGMKSLKELRQGLRSDLPSEGLVETLQACMSFRDACTLAS